MESLFKKVKCGTEGIIREVDAIYGDGMIQGEISRFPNALYFIRMTCSGFLLVSQA